MAYICYQISRMSNEINYISRKISVFHGRQTPEEAMLVGYGAILEAFNLPVPLPRQLSLISSKNRQYVNEEWRVFTSRHLPDDTLYKHLVFALKYEGINLLIFKKLFETIPKQEIEALVQIEVLGQYSRRIWFLYEWLMGDILAIPNLNRGNAIPLIDPEIQFAIKGVRSSRHKIINNLPGTVDFCPIIFNTARLKECLNENCADKKNTILKSIQKDLLQRTSSFLLLKDSKASFTIEGESPKSRRAARWGQAIGQAGSRELSKEELIRLQQIVIENTRFVDMGFRNKGGFIGEHDRMTGEPLPNHISAKWQDLDLLISGLIRTHDLLIKQDFDPVLAASVIAFGFVFIHPFTDGNGRIQRYLVHDVLAKKQFGHQGMIFPVSASILEHLDEYRNVLEYYSRPLLDLIEWKETADHNVEVINDTLDYYRYFDATRQAEYLYDCVRDTIEHIIPQEVDYLIRYDTFKKYLEDEFDMPDSLVALIVRFLEQNSGKLSKRAREMELGKLNENEIAGIEEKYRIIMKDLIR